MKFRGFSGEVHSALSMHVSSNVTSLVTVTQAEGAPAQWAIPCLHRKSLKNQLPSRNLLPLHSVGYKVQWSAPAISMSNKKQLTDRTFPASRTSTAKGSNQIMVQANKENGLGCLYRGDQDLPQRLFASTKTCCRMLPNSCSKGRQRVRTMLKSRHTGAYKFLL